MAAQGEEEALLSFLIEKGENLIGDWQLAGRTTLDTSLAEQLIELILHIVLVFLKTFLSVLIDDDILVEFPLQANVILGPVDFFLVLSLHNRVHHIENIVNLKMRLHQWEC